MTCAVVLLVWGCKGGEESAEPDEVIEILPSEPAEEIADPAVPEAPPELTAPEAAEPAAVAQPQPAPPPRDLAAELRAAMGSPADCLQDYRPSTARTIRISISAVVRPTGMIIEPTASGSGLSANDRRCVEQRVGNVTLPPLGREVSEPVSTYVDIQYQPPVVEESDVGAPDPELDDVVKSLPKKEPIAPSGVPIEGGEADPIEGPSGVPIDGPEGVPVEGPKPQPIDGY